MSVLYFLKKKKPAKNNTVQIDYGKFVVWDSDDAIFVGFQSISNLGIHINCDVKYFPSNRVVVCRIISSDAALRYETLVVPSEINTADGLLEFIKSEKMHWLAHSCKLSDEVRQRIDAAFIEKKRQTVEILGKYFFKPSKRKNNAAHNQYQCPKDKHNFIKADAYTEGTLYKCEKCGLEVLLSSFSETIFKEYFGSYIGGLSHKWNPSDMRAEDIESFSLSFGNLPIVTVRYDGSVMKVKNRINGSRDGWMSFPEGYFDEKIIKLSNEDRSKLCECLSSLDFASFTTSPNAFGYLFVPGAGVRHRFFCYFSNGKSFECLYPCCDDFNALVKVVKSIIGIDSEPVFSKGLCDSQETGWICSECGAGNNFDSVFCGKCGTKRPW